jgi:ATP-dependent protease ClpP protease subunit
MDIDNLKNIVGKAESNKPAVIRFFGGVDEYSVCNFNEEFLWLQNSVQPSKIVVLINSEGGSVLHGMSTFSIIQSCPIEVDCVIEGIAASMGSVIWAAGKNLYMHDYSLLMIHNPFNSCGDDKSAAQSVNAFRSQLETIYHKRFGMTKEQVKNIMNGEEGEDGTFFTAQEAVKAGFIPQGNILKTSKTVRDKVKSQIDGVADVASLRNLMSSVVAEVDEKKLIEKVVSICKQNEENPQFQESNTIKKMENQVLETISAQLGFSKDAQMDAVKARVTELIGMEASLKDIQSKYTALEIKAKGTEAELANTKNELSEVQASLKKYQDAEAAAHEAEINALIEDAVKAGKIEATAKDSWTVLAHSDFDTVKATLASIQGREDIPSKIANDPANVQNVQSGITEAERELDDKIKAVCGDKFSLKRF